MYKKILYNLMVIEKKRRISIYTNTKLKFKDIKLGDLI